MPQTAPNKNSFLSVMQRIRVPAGFILGPLMILSAKPTWSSIGVGGVTACIGLAIRAWASGHLRKNERLAITGPYAYTRNPLYLGTLVMGAGIAICAGTLWFAVLFVSLYLIVYISVMIAEAGTMRELFPESYEEYRRHVPLLFPRLTPWRGGAFVAFGESSPASQEGGFDLSRYLRHREYRAAIGLAVVVTLLVMKLVLLGLKK